MDRNAPPALMDTPQRGYDESKALIARWRGRGRLDYAITPRFAITSTDAQLEAAGALAARTSRRLRADPPRRELRRDRLGQAQFPWAKTYLDVYARYGLLGPRSIFGHCIHLAGSEVAALAEQRLDRRLLPDLEPVSRLGPVRQAAARQGGRARRAGDRRRRRHQLFDAGDRGRGLQGAADGRPVVAGDAGLLPDDARQRARAGLRGPRSARSSPAARPTSSCSIPTRRRRWPTAWSRTKATSTRSCSC